MLKRRPDIRLSIPRIIVPGRPFRVRIHLDCPRPLRIDGVSLELGGRYWNIRQNQYGEQRFDTRFYGRTVDVVASPTELRSGRHELEATLVVPEDAPSTYRGSRIAVEHFVTVRIDIPWWPDARASFALQVINPGRRSGGERRVWSSDPDGPRARHPYAEFSLSSTELVPSEQVLAVVALSNVELNRYRSIHITLVAFERIRRFLTLKHALAWARWRIDLDAPKENEPVHFRLEVPPTVVLPPEAVQPVTVDWQGPVETLIQDLAARAGYSFRTTGQAPANLKMISIVANEEPLFGVIRRAGAMAHGYADIAFNPSTRTIEIRYGS